MKSILKGKLGLLFSALSSFETVYLPVDEADQAHFKKWSDGAVMSDATNTVRSAKDFFFPQTENLVEFNMTGKELEIIDPRSEAEDFVVFGVRACDYRSFSILDRVFLSDPVDTYYKSRREHGTIITLACTKPSETCFCKTYGINPAEPDGDVSAWLCGDRMFFEFNTEKGKRLEKKISSLLEDGDDSIVAEQKKYIGEITEKLPLAGLKTKDFYSDKMLDVFGSEKWRELSQSCLGCGTCTFVCPTCQCYDIRDFDTGHGIKRFRCWDSCMYSEFTKMSAGQPRLTQLERFRQRFMHKLVYFPKNNDGVFGCVGCGRCLAKCPISMNIVKVMKALGGNEDGK